MISWAILVKARFIDGPSNSSVICGDIFIPPSSIFSLVPKRFYSNKKPPKHQLKRLLIVVFKEHVKYTTPAMKEFISNLLNLHSAN
ncbi:hypothetical protein MTP04_11960 [Lysinibacillus sp. PLM2]|nr:hypothetical protein MTP04_11960 [Lysinibacillus sp. PLM2]